MKFSSLLPFLLVLSKFCKNKFSFRFFCIRQIKKLLETVATALESNDSYLSSYDV